MKARGVGSTECLTLRTFDPEKRQCSIYWVSRVTGKLDPVPVAGRFAGKHGEFYAADEDNGRPRREKSQVRTGS